VGGMSLAGVLAMQTQMNKGNHDLSSRWLEACRVMILHMLTFPL
jgi:hypothetical protein